MGLPRHLHNLVVLLDHKEWHFSAAKVGNSSSRVLRLCTALRALPVPASVPACNCMQRCVAAICIGMPWHGMLRHATVCSDMQDMHWDAAVCSDTVVV